MTQANRSSSSNKRAAKPASRKPAEVPSRNEKVTLRLPASLVDRMHAEAERRNCAVETLIHQALANEAVASLSGRQNKKPRRA